MVSSRILPGGMEGKPRPPCPLDVYLELGQVNQDNVIWQFTCR